MIKYFVEFCTSPGEKKNKFVPRSDVVILVERSLVNEDLSAKYRMAERYKDNALIKCTIMLWG